MPRRPRRYWGHSNVSDWKPGSSWEHRRLDGSEVSDVVGVVVESDPPRRLVTTWSSPHGQEKVASSKATFEIEPFGDIVRLRVIHEDLSDESERRDVADGWSSVLSNLKTFLETGTPLSTEPWRMHRGDNGNGP